MKRTSEEAFDTEEPVAMGDTDRAVYLVSRRQYDAAITHVEVLQAKNESLQPRLTYESFARRLAGRLRQVPAPRGDDDGSIADRVMHFGCLEKCLAILGDSEGRVDAWRALISVRVPSVEELYAFATASAALGQESNAKDFIRAQLHRINAENRHRVEALLSMMSKVATEP